MESAKEKKVLLAWVVFLGLLLFYLLFRNTGLHPSVFADEYIYSKSSRLLPLGESAIPGYIYLKLYSITNYCGDGFLGCAKIINAIVFVAAAPFVYLTSRRVAGQGVSFAVSILAAVGPINSYTAYFMPESFYFLSFWVFCWYLLDLDFSSGIYRWLVAGMVYAVSALVKPHAIFYLPAVVFYIAFLFFRERRLLSRASLLAVGAFLGAAALAKFSLSYALAGRAGLTMLGPLYGSKASSVASGSDGYIQILQLALESFKGNMLVVALVYGLPFMVAMVAAASALVSRSAPGSRGDGLIARFGALSVLSLLVLLNLVCVVALFTASVAGSGPHETPYRLHMRYYDFALPLLYIVVAGVFSSAIEINRYMRYAVGAVVAMVGVYALWTHLAPYIPSYVDGPEIRGLHVDESLFRIVGGLLVFALVLSLVSMRQGARFYVYLALPLFSGVSAYHINLEMNRRLELDVYDKAGIFAKNYLPPADLSRVLVVGTELDDLYRPLYYIDNAKAWFDIIPPGADVDLTKLPPDKDWVLIMGDHEPVGKRFYRISMEGFSLVRASVDDVIDFRMPRWPGMVLRAKGLSDPESWGTWSKSGVVAFEFAAPLPAEAEIELAAHAFGPNIGGEFEASLGGSTEKFTLSANNAVTIIKLHNPDRANVLRFKVPHAVSPKALGLGNDDRNLGIGFVEMKIIDSRNKKADVPRAPNS